MDVVLFHHALGQTPGFLGFARDLRAAGHEVVTPDLYEGRVFSDLDAGVAFADGLGTQEVIARAARAVEGLAPQVVYAGFSLGSVAAQALAQGRAGCHRRLAVPRWCRPAVVPAALATPCAGADPHNGERPMGGS